MSYILDALRKADAERSRGSVPSLHAQPTFAGPSAAAPARRAGLRQWGPTAALAMLVVVAAALWYWFGTPRVAPPAAPVPQPMAPQPATAAAPRPSPAPLPVPPAAATTPGTPPDGASTLAPTPMAQAPAPAQRAAPPPARTAAPALEPPRTAPARAAALRSAKVDLDAEPRPSGRPASAVSATDTAHRVYALNELPDEIRRALPALSVGGSMYSNTPADRLLILNGMILHEGERFNAELEVQQIRLKSAVLSFRGYRYELTY